VSQLRQAGNLAAELLDVGDVRSAATDRPVALAIGHTSSSAAKLPAWRSWLTQPRGQMACEF